MIGPSDWEVLGPDRNPTEVPMNVDLTHTRVRELLDYDPMTGIFRWRKNRSRGVKAGDIAGSTYGAGYWRLSIDDQRIKARRLAWFYVYGVWPTLDIDHHNGDKMDNRIANLREATVQQNKQNTHRANRNNQSGFLGVSPAGHKWQAMIFHDAKAHYLGRFDTPEQASVAYLAAKRRLHPFW